MSHTTRKTQEQHIAKKLKLEDESLTKVKNDTTIVNLNNDCLEKIFVYLGVNDLFHVIKAHSHFKIAADRAFARKYRKDPVIVSNYDAQILKGSYKIVRKFGHVITKLRIEFNFGREKRRLQLLPWTLLKAVVEYCGKSIITLEFYHDSSIVYKIDIEKMRQYVSELHTNFPNLIDLKIGYCNYNDDCPYSSDIIQTIPTLTSFSTDGHFFSSKNLIKFIDLNEQLERLTLNDYDLTDTLMDKLDASLPQLKYLDLSNSSASMLTDKAMHSNRFKNLKKFIASHFYTKDLSIVGFLSHFGEEIEELELYASANRINFVESITRFKKLMGVTLHGSWPTLDTSHWSPEGIREMILHNNQLMKVKIIWNYSQISRSDQTYLEGKYYDIIKDKLNGAQWNVRSDPEWISFSKVTYN